MAGSSIAGPGVGSSALDLDWYVKVFHARPQRWVICTGDKGRGTALSKKSDLCFLEGGGRRLMSFQCASNKRWDTRSCPPPKKRKYLLIGIPLLCIDWHPRARKHEWPRPKVGVCCGLASMQPCDSVQSGIERRFCYFYGPTNVNADCRFHGRWHIVAS